ncbi:MAG: hypothetical protein ACE14V_11350, partial [bacterium]
MKKAIIMVVVLALVGAGVYFWVIPTFFSAATSTGIGSSPVATPQETPPVPGTNTQDFVDKAIAAFPMKDMLNAGQSVTNILKNLDYGAAQNMLPQIDKCNSAFAEMQSAVNSETNAAPEDFRPDRKIPNFLAAQTMGKLLVVKGMGMEGQGKLDKAVNNYLLAAQFGSVFAGKNTLLIQKLIAIALEKNAYKPLKEFTIRHPDDVNNLKRIISALEKADQKRIPFTEPLLGEKKMLFYALQHREQYAKEDSTLAQLTDADANRILTEGEKVYTYAIQSYTMPYPQLVKEDPQSKLPGMMNEIHPLLGNSVPNYTAAYIRELYMITDNHQIRVMAALQLYHQDKKVYPNSLEDLFPNYLTTVPKDPFSDANFIYGRVRDTFYLYSIGPDLND